MAIEGALMEVHLVADTNLFFECKALEELAWSELAYDPVVILLTKPVLDEIDKYKKGSGRTRKRALEIFQRVRGMLESSAQEVEIQASSPRVVLRRTPPSVAPDPAHKDHLDYAKTDERLIGIASTLSAQASGYDVKLFTDDTGPASTGRSGRALPHDQRKLAEASLGDNRGKENQRPGKGPRDLSRAGAQDCDRALRTRG
jgi:PIN domain